jgi:hypothetical protein
MFRNLLTRAQNSKRQDRRSFNPQVPGSSPGGGTRRAGRRGARDASPESHPAREGPQPEPYGFGPSSPYLSRGRCLCSPRGCSQFALPHRAWQERRAPGWICRSARGCSGSSPGCVLFLIVFFNLRYIKRRNEQARWGSQPPPPQVSSSCPRGYLSPFRAMREGVYSYMSPGMRRFQKTLWWIVGVGWIAGLVTMATLLIVLR